MNETVLNFNADTLEPLLWDEGSLSIPVHRNFLHESST